MLNVNAITSTLAKMPDAALQKYAALHKEDPYIMALAVSESNRRKQMRSAAQAPQGMGEQPKVADQAVAEMAPQMLPEDQGIARLPVGNMNFASGGIIAFGDGGDVERYDGGGGTSAFSQFLRSTNNMQAYLNGTPAEKSALESAFRAATQGPTRPIPAAAPAAAAPANAGSLAFRAGQAAGPVLRAAGSRIFPATAAGAAAQQGLSAIDEAEGFYNDPNVSALQKLMQTGRTAARTVLPVAGGIVGSGVAPVAGTVGGAGLGLLAASTIDKEGDALKAWRAANPQAAGKKGAPSKEDLGPVPGTSDKTPILGGRADARTGYVLDPGVPVPSTAKSLLGPTVPDAPPTARDTGAGGTKTATATPAAAPATAIPSASDLEAEYQRILNKQDYKDPAEKEVAGLQKLMKENADRRIKEFDADVAKRGDVFKGREERLTKREAEIGAQREENTGLAFLNAGLAIMSTPGGLATALGKGARVGTEQFAAGLDKIRSAQAKLSEARDNLEELRINREDLTAKERRGLTAAADTAMIEAEKLGIDGLRTAGNIKRETAKDIFGRVVEVTKTQYEQAGQDRRNAATVAGGIQQAQIMAAARADGNNDAARLYETTRNNIVKAAEGIYGAAEKAAFIDAEMRKAIQQSPVLAQYVGTAGGGGAPAAAATHRLNPATGKIEPVR